MPRTIDGTAAVVADAAVWAELPEAHAKTNARPSTRRVETGLRHPKAIENLLQQSRTTAARSAHFGRARRRRRTTPFAFAVSTYPRLLHPNVAAARGPTAWRSAF